MRLLLDTHVLIWLSEGLEMLPVRACEDIDAAAARHGLAVSAITFWEVAMLQARGRLALTVPVETWRQRVLAQPSLIEIDVSGEIAIEAVQLPGALHPDPADRMLAATARVRGMRLATRDARLLEYGRAGHVMTLEV